MAVQSGDGANPAASPTGPTAVARAKAQQGAGYFTPAVNPSPVAAPTGPAAIARAKAQQAAGYFTPMGPQVQAAISAAANSNLSGATAKKTSATGGGSMFKTALDQAKAIATGDIAAQVAPLQAQIPYEQKLGTQEQGALTSEFNQLLPYAKSAAAYTGQFNQQAAADSNAIFQAANDQIGAQQQNAAAQAQQLAQQTGGPVSAGTFTDALAPYQTAIGQTGSVGRLNTLQLGTLGTDEATQFSGQVLPAMAMEQHATIRNQINDEIQKLKDQITTIQGTKSKIIDAKLPGLLQSAQTYKLNQLQLAQKKVEDARAWKVTNRTLDQKDKELSLAYNKEAYAEWLAGKKEGYTEKLGNKKYNLDVLSQQDKSAQGWAKVRQGWGNIAIKKANVLLGNKKLNAQITKQAQDFGLNKLKYAAYAGHLANMDANATARLKVAEQKNVGSILDAALGGSSSSRPVTITAKHYLVKGDPLYTQAKAYINSGGLVGTPPHGVYFDKGTGQFYTIDKTSETPQAFAAKNNTSGVAITDPNALYRVLQHALPDTPKGTIADAIRLRLGLPHWNPGQPANYSTANLMTMSLSDLTDLAVGMGFPASPQKASKQQLIDFIHHAQKNK